MAAERKEREAKCGEVNT